MYERKHSILVAEDDDDDQLLLKIAFNENGYKEEVSFVNNGIELIERLNNLNQPGSAENLPGFILLDLNMPCKDGREALHEIKASQAFKNIPVIVFSAAENMAEIRKCYDYGANSYVIKPNTYTGLLKVVESIKNYWFATAKVPACL